MPVSAHYRGKGRQVMQDMIARYGKTKGRRMFYATEATHGVREKLGTMLHRGAFAKDKA